jgi:hypothetical protein
MFLNEIIWKRTHRMGLPADSDQFMTFFYFTRAPTITVGLTPGHNTTRST